MSESVSSHDTATNGNSSASGLARRILRLARTASLGTVDRRGHPYVSFVSVAATTAGEPILLLSQLARHTRNIGRDARGALLFVAPVEAGEEADPLAGARLTIQGTVVACRGDDLCRQRFLARHPEAESYADFADFSFHRLAATDAHLVGGFGRIADVAVDDLMTDVTGCDQLAAAEAEAIAHVNADHAETVRLYAERLCGAPAGNWRVSGFDPEGADLMTPEGRTARLDFPRRVDSPEQLRKVLVELAQGARSRN